MTPIKLTFAYEKFGYQILLHIEDYGTHALGKLQGLETAKPHPEFIDWLLSVSRSLGKKVSINFGGFTLHSELIYFKGDQPGEPPEGKAVHSW